MRMYTIFYDAYLFHVNISTVRKSMSISKIFIIFVTRNPFDLWLCTRTSLLRNVIYWKSTDSSNGKKGKKISKIYIQHTCAGSDFSCVPKSYGTFLLE